MTLISWISLSYTIFSDQALQFTKEKNEFDVYKTRDDSPNKL